MAKKLKWFREGKFGNVKETYKSYCLVNGKQCGIVEIRVFKKGEYCLPTNWFPQTKELMPQKTKSLLSAKRKVQKWFDEFIKSQS